jgi:hypothetical protein
MLRLNRLWVLIILLEYQTSFFDASHHRGFSDVVLSSPLSELMANKTVRARGWKGGIRQE